MRNLKLGKFDIVLEMGGRSLAFAALTGSHNYNLNTAESDEDYKLFVYPSLSDLLSGNIFSKSATSDTVDYAAYDVRRLIHFVNKGQVNILESLFSVKSMGEFEYPDIDALTKVNLMSMRNSVEGMIKDKLNSLHKGTEKTNESLAEHGYSLKNAQHALRLVYFLRNFAETGNFKSAIWFEKNSLEHDVLMAVKTGNCTEKHFCDIIEFVKQSERYVSALDYYNQGFDYETSKSFEDYVNYMVEQNLYHQLKERNEG